ncbi:hypothetical protein P154DRAFT_570686 [Amniculicola lignicola CBS 123094]|uniref:Uncharacterized protein n=1 Tax=Amniculicola lignicola CBS 123094 TaxID=1392246 RepID=A0A6A5WYV2_9PLEO|nr:hypothetical protein P154DRAFT_570686 [Amniculicola lignicola CBS 123094]
MPPSRTPEALFSRSSHVVLQRRPPVSASCDVWHALGRSGEGAGEPRSTRQSTQSRHPFLHSRPFAISKYVSLLHCRQPIWRPDLAGVWDDAAGRVDTQREPAPTRLAVNAVTRSRWHPNRVRGVGALHQANPRPQFLSKMAVVCIRRGILQ